LRWWFRRVPSAPIRALAFQRQPTLVVVPSVKPIETKIPLRRAVWRRRASSGPSIRAAEAASLLKSSCVRIGASSAAQTGNPGRKASGKATSRAPWSAASSITEQAFSTLRSVSRNTGATWATATL
jgi:hypothetical protein